MTDRLETGIVPSPKVQSATFLFLCSCIFFAGIYLVPEKIKIWSILFGVLIIGYYLVFLKEFYIYSINILWIIYIIVGLTGTILNGAGNLQNAIEFVISICLGVLVSSMKMRRRTREKLVQAMITVAWIVIIGCFLQIIAPDVLAEITRITLGADKFILHKDFVSWNRIVGFSYQTGVTAHYLCLFCIAMLSEVLTLKQSGKIIKAVYICLFVISLVLILLTEKRSTFLAVFVIAFALFILFYKKNAAIILLGGGVLVSGAGIIICFTELGRKMLERTLGSNPFTGRLEIYSILLDMVKENPLLGKGFGSTLTEVVNYTNGHNIYLQTLAESGIVGFAILLIILGYGLSQSIKVMTHAIWKQKVTYIETFCVGYQLYFIIVGFMGNVLYDIFPLVAYMISFAVIQSVREEQTVEAREEKKLIL